MSSLLSAALGMQAIKKLKEVLAMTSTAWPIVLPFVSKPGRDVPFDVIAARFPNAASRWLNEWNDRRGQPEVAKTMDWCDVVTVFIRTKRIKNAKPSYCGGVVNWLAGRSAAEKAKCDEYDAAVKWVEATMERIKSGYDYKYNEDELYRMLNDGSSGLFNLETYGEIMPELIEKVVYSKSNMVSLNTLQQLYFWRASRSECTFRVLRDELPQNSLPRALIEAHRQDIVEMRNKADPQLGPWGSGRSMQELAYDYTRGRLNEGDEKKAGRALMSLPM